MATAYTTSTSTAGNSSGVWQVWVSTSSSTASTAADDIWSSWASTSSTAASITNDFQGVWTYWVSEGDPIRDYVQESLPRPYMQRPSSEEILRNRIEHERREAEWRAEQARLAREREISEKRAEELLLASITKRQKAQYRKFAWFTVRGASGAQYRIRKGRIGNVDVVEPSGAIVGRLCAHPRDGVPDCDTMLAQKLMLEVDDAAFLRVANRHDNPGGHISLHELH